MFLPYRKWIIGATLLLGILGSVFLSALSFNFDFEQFFPEDDPDLEFFRDFIDDFESDANFLLIAVDHKPSIFDSSFLDQFHSLSLDLRDLPHIKKVQSLTMMDYPVKTPFGVSTVPIIHRSKPARYEKDKKKVLNDKRFVNNLISEDAQSLTIALKTVDNIGLSESHELIDAIKAKLNKHDVQDAHLLGRAYFTSEIVKIQGRELMIVMVAASTLVLLILIFLFKRPIGVAVAVASIGLGLLFFMEILGIMGSKLNAMSAFYPVLMLIVGTSDVIHIMSKYVDELKKGRLKDDAMLTTIKQIGMATLLTSATTAVGFASLMTSKVALIREFGMNSAIGVIVAYLTTIFFTTSLLSLFSVEQIIKEDKSGKNIWDRLLNISWPWVLNNRRLIVAVTGISILLCGIGISKIETNYTISGNLPKGAKVTKDFMYFEEQFSGFRPFEFAVFALGGRNADDYEVVREVSKLEDYLYTYPDIKSIVSQATLYKSLEQMSNSNRQAAFIFPESEKKYNNYKRLLSKFPADDNMVMISKDGKKTRISSRIADIGADRIKEQAASITHWIEQNIDANIISIKQTGTGLILDKNSVYVRDSLLYGLGLALIVVSILMGLLFRDIKMLFISLVPNIIPILFAAALLGYLGIDLEAGVSIVFAIVFGIAVDDTIHFLSKYKLARNNGHNVDDALAITFKETGKAIIFTTIILFFGFMVMLFSSHPPSQAIGVMISVTLISALVFDLTILPVLIRKFLK